MEEKLKEIRETPKERWKIQRWITVEEAEILHKVTSEVQPEVIFESGTANGYSAMWLSLSGSPVITFDPVDRIKVWDKLNLPHLKITYVQSSFTELPKLYSELQEKSKLFFIDGSHKAMGVWMDYRVIRDYAKEGDVVVLHDVRERGVMAVWGRLQSVSKDPILYDTARKIGRVTWTG